MEKAADLVMDEMQEIKKKSPLATMKLQLADTDKKIDNINRAIAAGVWSSSTSAMLAELEETASVLRADIGLMEYQESQMLDRDRVLFLLHKYAKLNRDKTDDRRKLINSFVNAVYLFDDGTVKIVTVTTEGTERLPLESIPYPSPGSDNVTSGVLIGTHPNQIMFWYITRM